MSGTAQRTIYVAPDNRPEIKAALEDQAVLAYRVGYLGTDHFPGLDVDDTSRAVSRFLLRSSVVLDWRTPELRPPTEEEVPAGAPFSFIPGGVDAIAVREPNASVQRELANVKGARDVRRSNALRLRYGEEPIPGPISVLLDFDSHPQGRRSFPTARSLSLLASNAEHVLLWESFSEARLCCHFISRSPGPIHSLHRFCQDSGIELVVLADAQGFPAW